MVNEWIWNVCRLVMPGKFKLLGETPVTVPHWLPQIPHGIFWDPTRIIWLKWSLSYNFRVGTGFISLRVGPVCGCCEYGNEPTTMMKNGECFEQMSKCWLPKEELVLVFVESILSGLRQSHWSLCSDICVTYPVVGSLTSYTCSVIYCCVDCYWWLLPMLGVLFS